MKTIAKLISNSKSKDTIQKELENNNVITEFDPK